MRRRQFIAFAGGAAAIWPLAARGQQPRMPVIGYLTSGTAPSPAKPMVLRGLGETGFVEGRNVVIEYRFADGQYDRLPALAADLVRRQVSVLVASGGVVTALAAKAATATIPIVFAHGGDPVKFGLVASLNRPGGNITGIAFISAELEAKRLGLLHELVPSASTVAVLVNPTSTTAAKQSNELKEAAKTLGLRLHFVNAASEREFDRAFANIAQMRAGALLVAGDPFYYTRRERLIALAARHSLPAIYDFRVWPEAGGLASYATDLADAYRQVGIYVGRILKGERPADLPVIQSTRFEFVINLKTAKALGITIQQSILLRADEVIE